MQQDITQILVFDTAAAPRSVVDILELSGNVAEAAQTYRRHWQGGAYAGGHAGYFIAIRAGYTLEDGSTFFLPGYSRLI